MKVKIGEKTYFIDWNYKSSKMPSNSRKMSMMVEVPTKTSELMKKYGGKLPEREKTTCILRGEDKEIVFQESVVRYFGDTFSYEKARTYSLDKLLNTHFSKKEDRKQFWEAYINRNQCKS